MGSKALADEGKEAAPGPAPGSSNARAGTGFAPDPPPIRSATQWLIAFEYRRGKVTMRDARKVQLKAPVSTPRRMGRFAAELLSGPTVVERVRFDFPLVGSDELAGQKRPSEAPPSFASQATVTHRIMLPDTPRASRARLVDRATGAIIDIPWPPNRKPTPTQPKTASSAGVSNAGISDAGTATSSSIDAGVPATNTDGGADDGAASADGGSKDASEATK
ncbi:MAG: hypothetical protein FWD57_15555 [Polyangiaceae bacterium]|nr:hypothetical protein [Polyangiaceae bacterium]